ncbi:MAG TPA: TonB family protein [Rectinemataceae bacterium]|nr:TonB family protein [Rectinemataceae bacterium]
MGSNATATAAGVNGASAGGTGANDEAGIVGGSGGVGSLGSESSESAYFAQIRAAIERGKIYPPAARMRGTEGLVRIRLSISADGRLLHAALSSSSGSSLLDQAALDLVAKVFPLANPTGRRLDPTIAVNYSLRH